MRNVQAKPDQIPRAAKTIAIVAREHGWAVQTTYGEGPWGRDKKHVTSIAVRFTAPHARMWAMWLDGKYKMAYIMFVDERTPQFKKLNLTQIKTELTAVKGGADLWESLTS